MICPCKDCTTRWVSNTTRCHSSCKRYQDWHDEVVAKNEYIRQKKKENQAIGKIIYSQLKKG